MAFRGHDGPAIRSRRGFLRGLAAGAAAASAASELMAEPAAASLRALRLAAGEPTEAEYWARVREEFLCGEAIAYMNNGTLGPTPKPVYYTLIEKYRAIATDPGVVNPQQEKQAEAVRQKAAAFVGADPDEIALTHNTTEGMNFVANGLDLKAGDEILLTFHEHPGGLQPWKLRAKRSGVVLKQLKFPIPTADPAQIVQVFADAITPSTRVISVSHMMFQTGGGVPVKELAALARSKGILSLVDGAHPLGMMRLDLHDMGADFYAMSPHKWLDAPTGTGLLYLRREAQARLWPTIATTGWDNESKGAARYDRLSQRAWPLVLCTGAALDFQEAIGRERIESRVRQLAGYLRRRLHELPEVKILTSSHPALHCGLTGFEMAGFGNRDVVETLLRRHHVRVRYTEDGYNTVRVSTHYYNTEEHVDRVIEGLREIPKRGVIPAPPKAAAAD